MFQPFSLKGFWRTGHNKRNLPGKRLKCLRKPVIFFDIQIEKYSPFSEAICTNRGQLNPLVFCRQWVQSGMSWQWHGANNDWRCVELVWLYLTGTGQQVQLDVGVSQSVGVHWLQALQCKQRSGLAPLVICDFPKFWFCRQSIFEIIVQFGAFIRPHCLPVFLYLPRRLLSMPILFRLVLPFSLSVPPFLNQPASPFQCLASLSVPDSPVWLCAICSLWSDSCTALSSPRLVTWCMCEPLLWRCSSAGRGPPARTTGWTPGIPEWLHKGKQSCS